MLIHTDRRNRDRNPHSLSKLALNTLICSQLHPRKSPAGHINTRRPAKATGENVPSRRKNLPLRVPPTGFGIYSKTLRRSTSHTLSRIKQTKDTSGKGRHGSDRCDNQPKPQVTPHRSYPKVGPLSRARTNHTHPIPYDIGTDSCPSRPQQGPPYILRRTTSVLTTTALTYALGAGITAAAGTRLALQLLL